MNTVIIANTHHIFPNSGEFANPCSVDLGEVQCSNPV